MKGDGRARRTRVLYGSRCAHKQEETLQSQRIADACDTPQHNSASGGWQHSSAVLSCTRTAGPRPDHVRCTHNNTTKDQTNTRLIAPQRHQRASRTPATHIPTRRSGHHISPTRRFACVHSSAVMDSRQNQQPTPKPQSADDGGGRWRSQIHATPTP